MTALYYRAGGESPPPGGLRLARCAGGTPRLADKPLLDTLFLLTLEVASETGRPVQIHAGRSDADIDLPLANPVLLHPILEDPRWASTTLVVLHQAYPFVRELPSGARCDRGSTST